MVVLVVYGGNEFFVGVGGLEVFWGNYFCFFDDLEVMGICVVLIILIRFEFFGDFYFYVEEINWNWWMYGEVIFDIVC